MSFILFLIENTDYLLITQRVNPNNILHISLNIILLTILFHNLNKLFNNKNDLISYES